MVHPSNLPRPDAAARRVGALRRAAVRAAQAPSVLNTQPWQLRIHRGALHVHADHRRQLAALDPQRRVLTASVGCAVFAARASLAADGYGVVVRRFPDPFAADLLAVLEPDASATVDASALSDGDWLGDVRTAVTAEGVRLHVLDELERGLVSELNGQADRIENLDPTYRAELDAWTPNGDRDRVVGADECLALLVTDGDEATDWLRAGEAMMRARQVAAAAGHDVRPSTQVIEVASARARLRRALGLSGHPQMLLRVGRGSSTSATNRRRLVDVLVEES
ncbi:hypothetical protein [uncultured Jatrophihabitans sp.]|uniref:hypothetical protein n=1 Tax=uncultured Jatrophihabitans sp. TaxID=1610747 RepID=UPI0035CAA5C3